ncbi:hypothetical protein [Planosporangium mesophilum]|uniref:Uncharacterized protein n=1 Tax=Planosporangium mesophilum TaxID=689768 RepID=A0A8J3TLR4_9ACTN|nr:hypothetical protein [Planosporangium mesophilum]NJC84881.1 hypothetical protein [Planosporangium mesophilum]GII23655.1 hypothetical protein Pme01_32520 [Planosporangium mesophilum]
MSELRTYAAGLLQYAKDGSLGGVEILVEYQLPLTSMRVDAVLAGVHPKTGRDSYVVIELKQWSAASSFDGSDRLLNVEHTPRPRLHPGLQIAGHYAVMWLRERGNCLGKVGSVISEHR